MTRRFVIGAEGLADEANRQLKKYLSDAGSWWHWIDNMWLFVTSDRELTCGTIRSFITGLAKEQDGGVPRGIYVIVMEVAEDIDWAVHGAHTPNGNHIAKWLKGTWKNGVDDTDTE